MTADAFRRLQALRGLTRTGSTHTVLAAVQGDLQTVIEAVLDLAACGEDVGDEKPCPCVLRSGHDGEHACRCENAPARPATAPEGDAQPEDVSVDPEAENGPENAVEAHSAFPLFVAPDGFDNPTIWWGEREVLLRTDANADAFDALAGLVRAAQEAGEDRG